MGQLTSLAANWYVNRGEALGCNLDVVNFDVSHNQVRFAESVLRIRLDILARERSAAWVSSRASFPI